MENLTQNCLSGNYTSLAQQHIRCDPNGEDHAESLKTPLASYLKEEYEFRLLKSSLPLRPVVPSGRSGQVVVMKGAPAACDIWSLLWHSCELKAIWSRAPPSNLHTVHRASSRSTAPNARVKTRCSLTETTSSELEICTVKWWCCPRMVELSGLTQVTEWVVNLPM